MKRDMDLARKILLQIEAAPEARGGINPNITGYSEEEVSYHVMLLAKAGLVDAVDFSSKDGGSAWKAIGLTWAGHDFIEAAKDDARWTRAKDIVTMKGGGIAFDILKQVLMDLMKRAVFGGAA
jgi:DNA-binding transcriptional ArsR family regulator